MSCEIQVGAFSVSLGFWVNDTMVIQVHQAHGARRQVWWHQLSPGVSAWLRALDIEAREQEVARMWLAERRRRRGRRHW